MHERQLGVRVIQTCCTAPGPSMSASVKISPGWMATEGETFQPRPEL